MHRAMDSRIRGNDGDGFVTNAYSYNFSVCSERFSPSEALKRSLRTEKLPLS
jgi:hypothetical protein